MHKNPWRLGLRPFPTGGAYGVPQTPAGSRGEPCQVKNVRNILVTSSHHDEDVVLVYGLVFSGKNLASATSHKSSDYSVNSW